MHLHTYLSLALYTSLLIYCSLLIPSSKFLCKDFCVEWFARKSNWAKNFLRVACIIVHTCTLCNYIRENNFGAFPAHENIFTTIKSEIPILLRYIQACLHTPMRRCCAVFGFNWFVCVCVCVCLSFRFSRSVLAQNLSEDFNLNESYVLFYGRRLVG